MSWTLLLSLLFLLPSTAPAQTKSAPDAGFHARTDLVLVPTLVRDKHGHVSGLRAEDFSLLQDGKAQKIAFVEEVRTGKDRVRVAQTTPREFTNEFVTGER